MRSAAGLFFVVSCVPLLVSVGCEPRRRGAQAPQAGTAVATATATAPATATVTAPAPTATAPPTAPVPTATTAPAPTVATVPTAPTPPTAPTTAIPPTLPGGWPSGPVAIDPSVIDTISRSLGGVLAGAGVPAAGGGDAIDAALKAGAVRHAPGFSPASPISRARLKQGEHAGMNFTMQQGKCYVVLGAGGAGVTQLGLSLLFPATPPQAVLASDTANGANPVLGSGKPLCPPVGSPVRIDAVLMAGNGDVGVQVWAK